MYFHASPQRLPSVIEPTGYYERIDEHGNPVTAPFQDFTGLPTAFLESRIPETAFAKNMGGAILGSVSAHRKPMLLHIYATTEKPDVDISWYYDDWIDFDVTREVRYRKPVTVHRIASIRITKRDVEAVNRAYESKVIEGDYDEYYVPPVKSRMMKLKRQFQKRIKREVRD